jgi:hypothetical protein
MEMCTQVNRIHFRVNKLHLCADVRISDPMLTSKVLVQYFSSPVTMFIASASHSVPFKNQAVSNEAVKSTARFCVVNPVVIKR